MKKLVITLAALMVIASTGCGSDSTAAPMITYVSRGQSDSTPHLFTLSGTTATPTAMSIPIPTGTWFVASNTAATAVTYGRSDDTGIDVFLMGTDGAEKQLTTDGESLDSAFSPDGKTIAYVGQASGGDQIFTMNATAPTRKQSMRLPRIPLMRISRSFPRMANRSSCTSK